MSGAAFLRCFGTSNHHDLGLFSVGANALMRDAADQRLRENRRRPFEELRGELASENAAPGHVANDAAADLFIFEDFFEQVLDVVNIRCDESDQLLEAPMLLARDLPIKNVVEEELIHHGRDHHVDLAPGEVDQHALEPADLTRHI